MNRREFFRTGGAVCALPAASRADALRAAVRITGLETDLLRFPPNRGIEPAGVVLRLQTDAGITGWAYTPFDEMRRGPGLMRTILERDIAPVLLDRDPAFPKRLHVAIWKAVAHRGDQDTGQHAIAAADIALWDILGKAAGLPVYKILGACADRIPAYSMCGRYHENDRDLGQLRRAVAAACEEGFQAIKIQVGRGPLDDDVRRINVARQVVGRERGIMVNAHQAFHLEEAIRRGRVYQQMGCYWYEVPLPPYDHAAYADLARELDIPVASGENEYTKHL